MPASSMPQSIATISAPTLAVAHPPQSLGLETLNSYTLCQHGCCQAQTWLPQHEGEACSWPGHRWEFGASGTPVWEKILYNPSQPIHPNECGAVDTDKNKYHPKKRME